MREITKRHLLRAIGPSKSPRSVPQIFIARKVSILTAKRRPCRFSIPTTTTGQARSCVSSSSISSFPQPFRFFFCFLWLINRNLTTFMFAAGRDQNFLGCQAWAQMGGARRQGCCAAQRHPPFHRCRRTYASFDRRARRRLVKGCLLLSKA